MTFHIARKDGILGATVLLLLAPLFPVAIEASTTKTDSLSLAPAKPLRYRSRGEQALAVPGRIVHFPFHLLFVGGRYGAHLVWEVRFIDRLKGWLTTEDGRIGIRPLSNTDIGSGFRLFYKRLPSAADGELTSTVGAAPRQRQHHTIALAWDKPAALPGRLHLDAGLRKEPKESYFGVGQETPKNDRTSFFQEDLHAGLRWEHQINRSLKGQAAIGYHSVDIGAGQSSTAPEIGIAYTPVTLPGLDQRVHFIESSVGVRREVVDVRGSPTRGNRTRLLLAYHRALDEKFSHLRINAVSEQFVELFYRRTASLRVGMDWRHAPGDDRVPFYNLAYLGGIENLRGYTRGRFRDRGTLFASVTYKYPVWSLVDGTLFYESGRAFHALDELELGGWASSMGAGLRVWVPGGLVFEQLVAHSEEELRLLVNFKTIF